MLNTSDGIDLSNERNLATQVAVAKSGIDAPSVTLSGSTALAGAVTSADVAIKDLGKCLLPSPVVEHLGASAVAFVGSAEKVMVDDRLSALRTHATRVTDLPAFELAGPRDKIFFDPRTLGCGIVTCGGLCPGINNVVRGIVLELVRGYGIKRILGFRYGYEGLISRFGHDPIALTAESVAHIHHQGGTILGTSRGSQDAGEVVDHLEANGIGILFVVGGDGTIRGAMQLSAEIEHRRLKIGVVGVPKTIDNDIHFIDRSFGFESAYAAAVDVVRSARVEAMGVRNGIGLVKLMGRHSGFVACRAALASTDVDLVLIPEVDATLEGERGVLASLDRVLARKGHAVVVVAEGAAQDLVEDDASASGTDKSGNVKLKDVGVFLRQRIGEHYQRAGREVALRYFDPSYTIRSVRAAPADSVYCWNMARNAVHAAMAGNTEMLIGRWHGRFVHVPMPLATRSRKRVDVTGDLWMSVIEATGQPRSFA
jgi:6-phosphofructokinase 1